MFSRELIGVKTQCTIFLHHVAFCILSSSDPGKRVTKYRNDILPAFPPVLHQWFIAAFPDPAGWFQARLSFARSVGAWSMLGHVIGLGDRHAENILMDVTNGECVHVDFDCLFDQVRKLP